MLRSLLLDLLVFAGLALIVYGVRAIYEPAAFIVGGVFLTATGALLALPPRKAE